MNKTAAGASQLAKCISFHACSCTAASSQLHKNKQKLHSYSTSCWHIFGYVPYSVLAFYILARDVIT